MKTVRTIIKRRISELELTPYRLWKRMRGNVSKQTVYNFLRTDSELNTKSLAYFLEALGLEITVKPEHRAKSGGARAN